MRERYLYETKNAGVGAAGPNRDLYQERLELSGIAGTTYEPYQRRSHHRSQHCTIDSEGVIRLEPGKLGIAGRPLHYRPQDSWQASHAGEERLGWSVRPTSAPAQARPNWIARDKQILVFTSYYQEDIQSSQEESRRIRNSCYIFIHKIQDPLAGIVILLINRKFSFLHLVVE